MVLEHGAAPHRPVFSTSIRRISSILTEIKWDNVQLQRMILMRLDHQSPIAIFVNGRILASCSVCEIFSPLKEGQRTRVDFDWRPFPDGTAFVNLSGTFYYIFLQYGAFE